LHGHLITRVSAGSAGLAAGAAGAAAAAGAGVLKCRARIGCIFFVDRNISTGSHESSVGYEGKCDKKAREFVLMRDCLAWRCKRAGCATEHDSKIIIKNVALFRRQQRIFSASYYVSFTRTSLYERAWLTFGFVLCVLTVISVLSGLCRLLCKYDLRYHQGAG
jgi:hypothetical protein